MITSNTPPDDELEEELAEIQADLADYNRVTVPLPIPGTMHRETWCSGCGRGFYALNSDDATDCPYCRVRALERDSRLLCVLLRGTPKVLRHVSDGIDPKGFPKLTSLLEIEAATLERALEILRSGLRP